jgi:hypothetical protein
MAEKRLILWNESGYLVTEKQYEELDRRRNEIMGMPHNQDRVVKEDELSDFLDENCNKYKYLGPVFFDHRI